MLVMDLSQSKSYDSASSDASSPFLRERRAKNLEQERSLRSRLNRIASADSSDALSLNSSFSFDDNSMESSLISFAMSRNSIKEKDLRKGLKWEKIPVEFSFGLLTAWNEAPPVGKYKRSSRRSEDSSGSNSASSLRSSSNHLLEKSSILRFVMNKVGEISKAAVQHRSGNVITRSRTPYVCFVVRDGESINFAIVHQEFFPSFSSSIISQNVNYFRFIQTSTRKRRCC